MATFQITVPDVALPRIQAAYGHPDPNDATKWINGTAADVLAALKGVVKSKVIDYETTQAAIADRNSRSADVGAW